VFPEELEQQDPEDERVMLELPDLEEDQVAQDQLVKMAFKELLDQLVHPAFEEKMEKQEHQEQLVFLE